MAVFHEKDKMFQSPCIIIFPGSQEKQQKDRTSESGKKDKIFINN